MNETSAVVSSAVASAAVDPRAWRATTIDSPEAWYYPLPAECLAVLQNSIQELNQNSLTTGIRISADQRAVCRAALQPVCKALESGRGFAIVDRIPVEKHTVAESQLLYWLVGQLLGEPFEQNVQGTLLYDVRDTGQNVSQGARFSVTNYESSFHTDNSFGQEVLDYVGLLCLTTAKSGGLSQVVSGCAAYYELRDKHPRVLEVLSQPFHVDRRGGTREGEPPTVQFPIFDMRSDELLVRYLRYWIEAGHEKVGIPLTGEQVHALDTLDQVLRQIDMRVEFALQRGQMFFINNRWILHNRTAFEDHTEPERKRHYVRLWLKVR